MAIAMAAIAYTFKEYCRGGGGGSADFAASAAPYIFAFHLAMGVRLVGSVLLRFSAGGGGQGGSLGVGARERWRGKQQWRRRGLMVGAVAVVRTTAGIMARHCRPFPCLLVRQRVGGGADDSASASLAVPRSLA